jgi:GH24 family phage-related lysozyme (muramidase)
MVSSKPTAGLTNVPLALGRFDALASFMFNLGAGAHRRSMLRRKVAFI